MKSSDKPTDVQTVEVPVSFRGVVTVNIPKDLEREQALKLANNLALARILATTENLDAPECEAFDDFIEETGIPRKSAERLWDSAEIFDVWGTWEVATEA